MKARLLLSLLILISACVSSAGQTNTELQQVTLYYFDGERHETTRSYVNFETGKRGPLGGELHEEFDLMYGGIIIGKDGKRFPDWFRVTDARSMIVDLDAKNWSDIRETPPFPKVGKSYRPPPLAERPMVIDVDAGSKEVSPYRQFILVRPGHIYLMRILHGNKVVYAMFRVESLTSEVSCVLSWKHVTPPKVDNEK